jgi:hypothetical protein
MRSPHHPDLQEPSEYSFCTKSSRFRILTLSAALFLHPDMILPSVFCRVPRIHTGRYPRLGLRHSSQTTPKHGRHRKRGASARPPRQSLRQSMTWWTAPTQQTTTHPYRWTSRACSARYSGWRQPALTRFFVDSKKFGVPVMMARCTRN